MTILGGSGRLGHSLAIRFMRKGFCLSIGSRHPNKALEKFGQDLSHNIALPTFHDYTQATEQADIIFITIPYPHSFDVVRSLAPLLDNKILVDTTVPILPQRRLVNTSIVAETQALLGNGVKVVSAFQTISASLLFQEDDAIRANVLICGNDISACESIALLAKAIGLNSIYCGNIEHSLTTENLALTLMHINQYYRTHHAGIEVLL